MDGRTVPVPSAAGGSCTPGAACIAGIPFLISASIACVIGMFTFPEFLSKTMYWFRYTSSAARIIARSRTSSVCKRGCGKRLTRTRDSESPGSIEAGSAALFTGVRTCFAFCSIWVSWERTHGSRISLRSCFSVYVMAKWYTPHSTVKSTIPENINVTIKATTPVRLMSVVSCPTSGSVVLRCAPCGFIGLGGCMFMLQKLFELRIVGDQKGTRFQTANEEHDPESTDRQRGSQVHPVESDLALFGDEVGFDVPVQVHHAHEDDPQAQRDHEPWLLLQPARQQQCKGHGKFKQDEES